MGTKEEILSSIPCHCDDNNDEWILNANVLKAMEEYASQFRQKVSDEDVKEIVFKLSHGQYAETEGDDFCARMDMLKKWMRDRMGGVK